MPSLSPTTGLELLKPTTDVETGRELLLCRNRNRLAHTRWHRVAKRRRCRVQVPTKGRKATVRSRPRDGFGESVRGALKEAGSVVVVVRCNRVQVPRQDTLERCRSHLHAFKGVQRR